MIPEDQKNMTTQWYQLLVQEYVTLSYKIKTIYVFFFINNLLSRHVIRIIWETGIDAITVLHSDKFNKQLLRDKGSEQTSLYLHQRIMSGPGIDIIWMLHSLTLEQGIGMCNHTWRILDCFY